MFLLKLAMKIVLLPVWIALTIINFVVKVWVHIYSGAKGFLDIVFIAMILGTVICYHDWIQVTALIIAYVILYLILFASVFIETVIDMARANIIDNFFV